MSGRETPRKSRARHRLAFEVLGGAFLILCLVSVGSKFFGANYKEFHMNLFTEAAGIVVTVVVVNRWYAYRERESLKRRLKREAGSRSNDIAISAVEWMRREGWLKSEEGLLKDADLIEANLENARLGGANLEEAELGLANLQNANLWGANLKGANFLEAKLQGACLLMADLREANLNGAKLQKADLMQANLYKADLRSADLHKTCLKLANLERVKLTEAKLNGTRFDGAFMREAVIIGVNFRGATMPDGTLAYEAGSDVKKFVDPSHPEFDKALESVKRVRRELGLVD